VNTMTKMAGVWIDHRRAQIVGLTPDGELSTTIMSKVGTYQAHRTGSRNFLQLLLRPQPLRYEGCALRDSSSKLNSYYDSVIDKLRGYGSLLILGPGEVKAEFKSRLLQVRLGERIAAVQTEGKMSDRQLVAKVKEYFGAAARVK
jgi:hypothetical protein